MAKPLTMPCQAESVPCLARDVPLTHHMWLAVLTAFSMAWALGSPVLAGMTVFALLHTCVHYQHVIRVQSASEAGAQAKLAAVVVGMQLDTLTKLLEPMSMYCEPAKGQVDNTNIFAFSVLEQDLKVQVKRCIQVIKVSTVLVG